MVKVGTSSVSNDLGMDQERVDVYTDRTLNYHESGLIIVSSGSIAVGTSIWMEMFPDKPIPDEEQSLATMGSAGQFTAWQSAYKKPAA